MAIQEADNFKLSCAKLSSTTPYDFYFRENTGTLIMIHKQLSIARPSVTDIDLLCGKASQIDLSMGNGDIFRIVVPYMPTGLDKLNAAARRKAATAHMKLVDLASEEDHTGRKPTHSMIMGDLNETSEPSGRQHRPRAEGGNWKNVNRQSHNKYDTTFRVYHGCFKDAYKLYHKSTKFLPVPPNDEHADKYTHSQGVRLGDAQGECRSRIDYHFLSNTLADHMISCTSTKLDLKRKSWHTILTTKLNTARNFWIPNPRTDKAEARPPGNTGHKIKPGYRVGALNDENSDLLARETEAAMTRGLPELRAILSSDRPDSTKRDMIYSSFTKFINQVANKVLGKHHRDKNTTPRGIAKENKRLAIFGKLEKAIGHILKYKSYEITHDRDCPPNSLAAPKFHGIVQTAKENHIETPTENTTLAWQWW